MQKDVIISICGLQQLHDGESMEPITLVTTGRYYRRGGQYYVAYDESPLTGLDGTRTVVRAGPGRVQVTRTGTCPSRMLFESGRRSLSLYHTEYGDMSVSVSCERIDNNLTDEGGALDVSYLIEIDNVSVGVNHLTIDVKHAKQPEEKGESLQ